MSDKQGAPTLPPLSGGGGNNGSTSNTSTPQQQQQTVSLQQVLAAGQGLNVLTTSAGQQFVITSQVPGLGSVISSATTNAGLSQVGVTRIVNITGTTPRVSVVGVASSSGLSSTTGTSSVSTTPTTTNRTTKVVLSTSPKLVRTTIGNMFLTPTINSSVASSSPSSSSPPVKKLKLNDTNDKITLIDDTTNYRRRIIENKIRRMRAIRDKYSDNASELFFLHNGGNMMEYQQWKKKSHNSPTYLHFLRTQRLDPDDDNEDLTKPLSTDFTNLLLTNPNVATTQASNEVKITGVGVTPIAVSTTLPAAVAQLSQQGGTPIIPEQLKITTASSSPVVTAAVIEQSQITGLTTTTTTATTTTTTLSSVKTTTTTTASSSVSMATPSASVSQPFIKLIKLPSIQQQLPSPSSSSSASLNNDCHNNQEQIVEKAKQEAYVMQRITELQRDGLWTEKRLPKIQEPTRTKAHWDYLLEEMVWLAADFAQERKWKKATAKKCARMVQKHFQEKAIQAQKAEKLQELRLKKIAGFVAKEIKTFWSNVEKLVEFKQQTRLEEKRKKALDQHLNFIVGQTEKYSSWLTEGLNKTDGNQSVPASINSSRISSPVPQSASSNKINSDDEFEPNQSSDDDEETIAKAEEEMKSTTNHKEEVELLKKESELPLDVLLPDDYKDKILSSNSLDNEDDDGGDVDGEEEEGEEDQANEAVDDEFHAASGESSDDEDTIMEQENQEGKIDHRQELDDLKAENDMTIDELMAKYSGVTETPMEVEEAESDQDSEKESDKPDDDEEEEEEDEEDDEVDAEDDNDETENKSESECESDDTANDKSQNQSDDETGVDLASLFDDFPSDNLAKSTESANAGRQNEMDDVAAIAESIQPKGNTFLTTSVVTKVPFLLKHSLREYQHIGLDWLVTMYDRKLNGILADEMGLGKTVQTIALLAHLACEKSNWGPHLIIVPTSVMLNWEMECKKWCPGFKILTYYGTQKERKIKRTGWTKPNAFHICITSYKLVIQDHQSFRRKKWKYLILDEAQNIKNFKSQRWQLLLNFQSQRRLLLTGTPLQNNLMELWSLMHFLMPNFFQSQREFKEWFSNPVTGMIEGNSQYNEKLIRQLHQVLRPFLLRRLKSEVEKQLPKKYEHVIMCRLSKRQRFLYDDFMSRAKTKETLASGNLLSVINILMQLRKVCNHPNLFEVRPTVSPFRMEQPIEFHTPSLVWNALDYDPMKHIDLNYLNLNFINYEKLITAFASHRVRKCQVPKKIIEEIDTQPLPPPKCPSRKIKINIRLSNQTKAPPTIQQLNHQKFKSITGLLPTTSKVTTSTLNKTGQNQPTTGQNVTLRVASGQLHGYSVQLVQHQGNVKAIPVQLPNTSQVSTSGASPSVSSASNTQRFTVTSPNLRDGIQGLSRTVTVKQGDNVQRVAVQNFAQILQTSTGRHVILTSNQQNSSTVAFPIMTSGQRLVISPKLMGLSTTVAGRQVIRAPSQSSSSITTSPQITGQLRGIVTRNSSKTNNNTVTTTTATIPQKRIIEVPKSEFYLQDVENERRKRRVNKLQTIGNINSQRCTAHPIYGDDLFTALRIDKPANNDSGWNSGWLHIKEINKNINKKIQTRKEFFTTTNTLLNTVKTTEQIVDELKIIIDKFVFYVPAVSAPSPIYHVSHPSQHRYYNDKLFKTTLEKKLIKKMDILHPIVSSMITQFPDPRLIQYDCGKLQSLDILLRKLKTDNHRVLIFTQMTRMLDVLEAFLNCHGYIYLRLDGTTKIDQRQLLMERFNNDKRIFCFILSTRSGGVGVNLTGADTVIFYDSDWNPTMDAQAQDRCHRIGQTRDVHIYRLISEKTIEENILKKANQKRLLGDLAIEGGNFTTAYFKSTTIQDLFNVDQDGDATTRMADVVLLNKEREKDKNNTLAIASSSNNPPSGPPQQQEEKSAMGALESALASVEEDLDVQATKTAKAEAVADLAEFDENIPLEEADKDDPNVSKAEIEVQNLVSQLTPVERYAMKFVEEAEGSFSAAQLAAAEAELEQQKREWELDRLRALREEKERRMRLADDDDEKPLTYTREDAQNQVWLSDNTMETMPMWCPPTPPTSDDDVYIDFSLNFLYENIPIPESQLPPVYIKKETTKRIRTETPSERDTRRPPKIRHKEESIYAPRSLFDRPSAALMKIRRDIKSQKHRTLPRPSITIPGLKQSSIIKTTTTTIDNNDNHILEWMIHEDWSLLQAIQVYQSLPLNLVILSPGHTPNWDLVADIVNNTSRIYRSPKQCRSRYESIIVPREEGKLLYDITPKKQKKQKGTLCKIPQIAEQPSKTNRPMRTSQLYNQDKNINFTSLCCGRYDTIKTVSNKRSPPPKSITTNSTGKNSKHAPILSDWGIQYDNPLAPIDVAIKRAERIAKEKSKNTVLTAEQLATAARIAQQQKQQQQQAAQVQQQSQQAGVQTASQLPVATTTTTIASAAATTTIAAAAVVAPTNQLSQIVTTVVTTPVTQKTPVVINPTVSTPQQQSIVTTITPKIRQTPIAIQETNRPPTTVVSVGNLQTAQQQQQRLSTGNIVGSAQNPTISSQKGLVNVTIPQSSVTKTMSQVQLIRQQQQQQLQLQQQRQNILNHQQIVLQPQTTGQQKVITLPQSRTGLVKNSPIINQGHKIPDTQMAIIMQNNNKKTPTQKSIGQIQLSSNVVQSGTSGVAGGVVNTGNIPGATVQQNLSQTHIFTQAGFQQAGTSTTGLSALVKANMTNIRTNSGGVQPIRQLSLHQPILSRSSGGGGGGGGGSGKTNSSKITQLSPVTSKTSGQKLIVKQGGLTMPMKLQNTIQQYAQVATGQGIQTGQVVFPKSQLQTRVIPVTVSNNSGVKGTIQVVTSPVVSSSPSIASVSSPGTAVGATTGGQLRQSVQQGKSVVTNQRANTQQLAQARQIYQAQLQQQQQQQQQNQQGDMQK